MEWSLVKTCAFAIVLILVRAGAGAGVRETVKEFESGKTQITVDCFAPTAKGKHPLVVLLHGSGGLQQATHDGFKAVARNMAGKGYVVLIPHFFDREGGDEQYTEVVKDAIAFGIASGVVDEDRIGLLGFSMGVYLASVQATGDPRVKAVVAVSGLPPYGPVIKFPPTLILRGSMDEGIPARIVKEVEESFEANKIPCVVHVYPRTGHNFEVPKFLDAGRRAGVFFDTYLKKKPDPTRPANPTQPNGQVEDSRGL